MSHIMVLDDVHDAAVLVKRILERKGHAVTALTEEEAALEHARQHPVDLVILDIKLKKMTGVEVLEELRKIDPRMRIMMLTGYPTLETARESVRLGALDYCVKPIDKEELEAKVARALAMSGGSSAGAAPEG